MMAQVSYWSYRGRKGSPWLTIRELVCNNYNSWVREREIAMGLRISKDILFRGLAAQMTRHGKVCVCVTESETP